MFLRWPRPFLLAGLACSLTCLVCLGTPPAAGAHPPPPAKVWASPSPKSALILYSAGPHLPAYRRNLSAFMSQMDKAGFPASMIHVEFLDLIRHGQPEHRRRLGQLLRQKYAGKSIELVVTVESLARDFLLREMEDLCPGAPLVAILASEALAAPPPGRAMVQVPTILDVAGTLRLALSLLPETKGVFVVLGHTQGERNWERDAREQLEPWRGKLDISYSSWLTYEETLEQASSLPPQTLVIYIAFYQDPTGRDFVPRDVAAAITQRANAPVFGIYDQILGLVVGGSMLSYEAEGARAADLALDILSGDFFSASPLVTLPITLAAEFNFQQLARWGLEGRPLPAGSALINRPDSIWDHYWGHALGALAFIALQTGLIILLLAGRRRRMAAEASRSLAEERYRQVVENANEAIVVIQGGRVVFHNPQALALSGYSQEEYLGLPLDQIIHPLDRETVLERHRQRLAGLPVPSQYDLRIVNKQGGMSWFRCNVVAISWEGAPATLNFLTDVSQQRAAREELEQSESKLRAVLENSREAIGVSQEGRHTWVNPAYVRLFGYDSAEGILGRPVQDLIAPSAREDIREKMRRRAAGLEAPASYETLGLRRDGSQFDMEVNVSTYELQGANHTLVILRDIGEAKAAQEALRQSEEKFAKIFQHAPLLVTLSALEDGTYLEVNDKFLEVSGFSLQEVLGRTSVELGWLGAGDRRRILEQLQPNGRVTGMELELTAKDGRPVTCLFHGEVITVGGRPRLLTIALDISERKSAEEALRQSEAKFRAAFQANPMAMAITDRQDGSILSVNEAYTNLLGYSPLTLLGRTAQNLSMWANPAERRRLVELNESQGGVRQFLAELCRGDGERLTVSISSTPVQLAGRRCWLYTLEDRTELVRSENQRRTIEAQLRQALKMEAIGTLAGGISHDFNNILGAVLGFAEIALEDAVGGRADPQDLKQIIISAQRARDLVKRILTFGRKQEPDLKPLSLNHALQRAKEMLERTLPKMVAIRLHLAEGLPPVLADSTQMEQVLLNLAANAADAMPEGGELTLRTSLVELDQEYCLAHLEVRPGTYVRLEVSDSGQGMDLATQERVFEPFFTTKDPGKGTGLGLSTVYGIVKNHGGHIACRSRPGEGTTFLVDLPVWRQESILGPQEPSLAPHLVPLPAAARGATILLVDDEEPLRRLAQRTLSDQGFRVLAAASGEEALAIYGSRPAPPDLVVMDISMPGMGGFKALKEILALDPQARIIIASGYATQGLVEQALAAGAKDYVPKPFRGADLLAAIVAALDPAPGGQAPPADQ